MCARAAPEAWYPRQFIRQSGADPDQVDALLQMLALEGLVDKVPGTLETGAGVALTPLGRQVVDDPDLMDRLRRGVPVRPDDAGSVVRSSLRQQTRPYVTYALIAVNVLVYILQVNRPDLRLVRKWEVSGALVEQGEWWRLLTCMFLHGFFGHLVMNMFSLYVVGSLVERTWGRWRYLVIYFVGGWGGSCLGVAYTAPNDTLVGASGAICAVFGAIVVWAVLYGRYLPAEMMRRFRSSLVWSVVLTVGLALLAERMAGVRVSHAAHLGGVIVGALTAMVLHFQRFGAPVLRWAAVLLLLPLPVLSYVQMDHARKNRAVAPIAKEKDKDRDEEEPRNNGKKKTAKKDDRDDNLLVAGPFLRHHAEPVSEEADALLKTCEKVPLDIQAARKDAKKAKALLASVAEHQTTLKKLQQELEKARYQDKRIEEGRTSALELLGECRQLCDEVTAYLKDPGAEGKDKVKAKFTQLDDLVDDFKKLTKKLREL
jgi:membrane associated rhomboid family serine protease